MAEKIPANWNALTGIWNCLALASSGKKVSIFFCAGPKSQPQKCNLMTWYMVAGGVGTGVAVKLKKSYFLALLFFSSFFVFLSFLPNKKFKKNTILFFLISTIHPPPPPPPPPPPSPPSPPPSPPSPNF